METTQAPRDLVDVIQELYLAKDYVRIFEATPRMVKRIIQLEKAIERMTRQFEFGNLVVDEKEEG